MYVAVLQMSAFAWIGEKIRLPLKGMLALLDKDIADVGIPPPPPPYTKWHTAYVPYNRITGGNAEQAYCRDSCEVCT